MKKKRRVRHDPIDKINLAQPELPEANPLSLLQASVQAVQTTEIDGYAGVEAYNYLIQRPDRVRFATNCFGPGTLEDELGFRRIVLFFTDEGKVMGELDDDSRAELAKIEPPITEAELIEIMEEEQADWLRKQEDERYG